MSLLWVKSMWMESRKRVTFVHKKYFMSYGGNNLPASLENIGRKKKDFCDPSLNSWLFLS